MKYFVGIDIGGTNITAAIVNENYGIETIQRRKTHSERPYKEILPDILGVVQDALNAVNLTIDRIRWIGIGCPGTCNDDSGEVEYANNLHWQHVPLRKDVEFFFAKKTYLDNDANAAAYGEFLAGAAKGSKNAVVVTLGTGVGAGIIIDGKIYKGSNYAGAEIGHTVISVGGRECSCGRKGCFEAYASVTGLIKSTREAADNNPGSRLLEFVEADGRISGRTAFNAAKMRDEAGIQVVDDYITYLACGITNIINVFQPDILCIGGGICNEGDNLLIPLRKKVAEGIYSKNSKINTIIEICSLGNNAGLIGAAMLGKIY